MAVGIRASNGDRPVPQRTGRVISRTCAQLLAAAVGIVALMWILGSLLVRGSVPSVLGGADTQISLWAVEQRSPTLDVVTHVGSMMADTIVALAVTAVAVVGFRLWLGRWRESLVTVVAIVGELLIFLVITATVHRARPAVPQLDQAPPTSSFPSGHTGAAIALYGCLAVILLRNVTPRWVAVSLAVLGSVIPIVVAASRVYRGMHYLTDVLAGALASGIWLTAVLVVLLPTRPRAFTAALEPNPTQIPR
jgi:undecaprenyl-diphosphatase